MASVNKVIIVGNLGRDPETRYMQNGDAVTNIAVATTESWKDKNSGEKKELTEWHRVTFYRKLAEIAGQYLKKGSQVYVEGLLRTRSWQDDDGRQHRRTEIVLSRYRGKLEMLDRSSGPDTPNPFTMIFAEMMLRAEAARAAASPDDDHPFGGR